MSICWRDYQPSGLGHTHLLKASQAFLPGTKFSAEAGACRLYFDHVPVKGSGCGNSTCPAQKPVVTSPDRGYCLSQCPQCQDGQKYVPGRLGGTPPGKGAGSGSEHCPREAAGILPTGLKTRENSQKSPVLSARRSPPLPGLGSAPGLSSVAPMSSRLPSPAATMFQGALVSENVLTKLSEQVWVCACG